MKPKTLLLGEWASVRPMMNKHFGKGADPRCEFCLHISCASAWYSIHTRRFRCKSCFDPIAEATGELAAQINVGDEIDYKEIFAEAIGGIGNNAPFAALNMALDVRAQDNTKIANDLTTIAGINREVGGIFKPTPTRVSNWANNTNRFNT